MLGRCPGERASPNIFRYALVHEDRKANSYRLCALAGNWSREIARQFAKSSGAREGVRLARHHRLDAKARMRIVVRKNGGT